MKKKWLDLPVTEVEAEVWRFRFDPDRLLTIPKIVELSGHKGVGHRLLSALRRLQARGPGLPPNPEEEELIDLALRVTGAVNLERAYEVRKQQVWRHSQVIRHRRFHEK